MASQGMSVWGWIFLIVGWGCILTLVIFCMSRVLFGKRKRIEAQVAGGRERWATRIGLILAMAGNAIGLGNFLRFPAKAAANGGGAFMIPYFCALIFLGIPLMWVEWSLGRYGGVHGHGSTPGMFSLMWKNKIAKYIGTLGISLPFTIAAYYVFTESWTLGFAFFSGTGKYFGNTSREVMAQFLHGYQGVEKNQFFSSLIPALIFLAITLSLNFLFLYRGISKGIEILARYGMPILFVFAIVLVVRALTMGTPDPGHPDWNIANGMAFIWNPDFSRLGQFTVWLVAAGQIFFTLSLGQGMINTYASYVGEKDDIALNGLSTSSLNEFAEVILGGTIAIPIAVAFFGVIETQVIAKEGAFNLGFVSLPVIFQKIPLGHLFGAMWFVFLFIAGITSSVAMTQPSIAFLMDEFKWKRSKAVIAVFSFQIVATLCVVIFFKYGFLDELDFWAGTFGLVFFAVLEIGIFSWIFGVKKGWEEIHKGADIRVPRMFKFIIKYVTPVYMIAILVGWTYQDAISKFLMKGEEQIRRPYLWGARALFLVIIIAAILLVRLAWKRRQEVKT
jgi:NSS family neurotransmitter:Na+ symporter